MNVAPISHLFFADDTLLFTKASVTEAEEISDIHPTYEMASGQKINLEKSKVSFGRNVSLNLHNMLHERLQVKTVLKEREKYLGLPSGKKDAYQEEEERCCSNL